MLKLRKGIVLFVKKLSTTEVKIGFRVHIRKKGDVDFSLNTSDRRLFALQPGDPVMAEVATSKSPGERQSRVVRAKSLRPAA